MKKCAEDTLGDQAKRFVELKQQIAITTGLAVDAPRISYLATLLLQAERIQGRIIAGDDGVTSAELLELRSTIEEISPLPATNVAVRIIDGVACPSCGGERIALSNLDDRELAFLEHLVRRAHGIEAPKPPRHEFSPREFRAMKLAAQVDQIVEAKREADSTELAQLHGSLDSLIFPLVSLAALHRRFDPSLKEATPPVAPPAIDPQLPAAPSNVVELPPRRSPSIHDQPGAPLKRNQPQMPYGSAYSLEPDFSAHHPLPSP
jgi:hypothetical protein